MKLRALLLFLACVLWSQAPGAAQQDQAPAGSGAGLATSATTPAPGSTGAATDGATDAIVQDPGSPTSPEGPSIDVRLRAGATGPDGLSQAVEIVLLMTLLSLAPAMVMTMTCFTRIIIVLSFLKRAMSIQELPPRMVVTGFAMFMTIFIMMPVAKEIYASAYEPYIAEQIPFSDALDIASAHLNDFMLRQTRVEDIDLIVGMSGGDRPATPEDVPFLVTVPAFILSEIKTAFQMGFVLFLPFIAIDLVVSSILISMGMFTLPPIVVSTPLKLLLFILVDGWNLVVGSLAQSFAHSA